MEGKRKRQRKQFKLEGLQMYGNGERSMAEIEGELGITTGLLAKWRDALDKLVKDELIVEMML